MTDDWETESRKIERVHPTDDGHVHFRLDGSDYLMTWPDALEFGATIMGMAATAAYLIDAKEETLVRVTEAAWDKSRDQAHAAHKFMTGEK